VRRISVRTLMVLILGAAVGLAALRNANVYWASATTTVVVVAVATSVVGALPLHSRERSAWAGFAVFSGMYLAVAVGTVVSSGFTDYFGPTIAIEYVQTRASGQSDPKRGQIVLIQRKGKSARQELLRLRTELNGKIGSLDAQSQEEQDSLDSADRWRSWLPGALNTDEFRCVGHGLFALLSGLIGTVVGRIFYARRNRSETQTAWRNGARTTGR
jgi:hypothetical protein